jgi:hypothetical protein
LYQLRRPAGLTITGVPNPDTVFNIMLTPGRIFRNHWRWLRGSYYQMDEKYLTFQTTEKNALVVTDDGTEVITENADVLIGGMGEPIYKPYYLTLEVQSPHNLKELMDANSKGYFSTADNGHALKGFPLSIKTNDATLETQNYKLLAKADADLTYRINAA